VKKRLALTALVAAVTLSPGALADGPVPVMPADPAVHVVPRARFFHAVSLYRRDHRAAKRLRAQLVRERGMRAAGFTTADTGTAAALMAYVGGWPEAGAMGVSDCESHHEPGARNSTPIGSSHATGAWQVLWPSTWRSTSIGRRFSSEADARNPYVNAAVAWQVWRSSGGSFRAWADICAARGGG
jgi:hypothetical protein